MLALNKYIGGCVLGFIFLLLYSCENDMGRVAALNHKVISVEEAHGVTVLMSQSAKMKARIESPYMLRYSDTPRIEFPRTLHVDFFDSLLNIESTLDAHYGVYYEIQNKVYLKDSIRIINLTKKDTIYCEDLNWDQNTGKFYTHRRVRIYEPTQIIFGKGMEANQDFANVSIDTITGTVIVQQGQLP
jgi:LPS export ABC transporter protein LptC